MYQTHRRWWTVADAAQLLRVHTGTLYDACASGDFPHTRIGNIIKIPCEALRMVYVPQEAHTATYSRDGNWTGHVDPQQLMLDLGPILPIRRYRNTGDPVGVWDYERSLWGHNTA